MKQWWQRRSLKLRLAVWFTAVASGILLGLTPVVYWLIERRLHVEFDHQLRIDWNLIEAHLEADAAGRIRWRAESPAARTVLVTRRRGLMFGRVRRRCCATGRPTER